MNSEKSLEPMIYGFSAVPLPNDEMVSVLISDVVYPVAEAYALMVIGSVADDMSMVPLYTDTVLELTGSVPSKVYRMVALVGKPQEIVKVFPVWTIVGTSQASVTEPLPISEVIIFSLTAMALMVTPLTFSVRGPVYSVLEMVGVSPLVV